MPVTAIKCHVTDVPRLGLAAHLHGIEADLVDVDGPDAYVDLVGAQNKIDNVLLAGERVEVIERMDSVPHNEPLFTLVGRVGFDE